ncbi:MAG: amidohydrolase [Eubacteriales bacterium]|nr:amidohydrolase [Eubacteriales bacterium]
MREDLLELFYWFHRHPELSYEEFGTTEKIREVLNGMGVGLLPVGLETGLVAEVRGALPGPVQALRCDIDALPIAEQSGLSYASETPGKMHACGHDFHITAGLGAIGLLLENRERLCGSVRVFFQPAEESSLGALKVLEKEEAMAGVERIWGFHADPTNPVGTFGIREGSVTAAVDRFVITVTGRGCHGAHPDDGVDPIPAAAAMVQAFQTIVTRNINPFHPALISVTRLEAGNTWNVIPQTAQLEGTVRTMEKADRELFERRVREIAERTAAAYGAAASVEWIPGPPAVCNDRGMAEFAEKKAKEQGFLVVPEEQSLGGDDFSFYMEKVPGCYVKVGTGVGPTIHQPDFKVDPRAIEVGSRYLAGVLLG